MIDDATLAELLREHPPHRDFGSFADAAVEARLERGGRADFMLALLKEERVASPTGQTLLARLVAAPWRGCEQYGDSDMARLLTALQILRHPSAALAARAVEATLEVRGATQQLGPDCTRRAGAWLGSESWLDDARPTPLTEEDRVSLRAHAPRAASLLELLDG